MNEIDFIADYFPGFEQGIHDFNISVGVSARGNNNGYTDYIDSSFDKDSGYYTITSKTLDESHNIVGKSAQINGYLNHFDYDDNKVNISFTVEMNLEGDNIGKDIKVMPYKRHITNKETDHLLHTI